MTPCLTANDKEHKYYLDGVEIPGVTTILEIAGFTSPFNKDPHAALRGTYVHDATVLYDKGTLDWDSLHPELVPYVRGYEAFCKECPHEIIETELKVCSFIYRFAGRLDRIIRFKSKRVLLDIKTGAVDPANTLQTAAYQAAWEEMTGQKIEGRYSLYLNNTGRYKLDPHKGRNDKAVFLSGLATINWRLNNGRM